MDATTVTVDLAKEVFEVAPANRAGRILERTRLTRRQFEAFVDGLPAGTTVVMEACGTAHYWGRRGQAHGHQAQLVPVQYVKPYVRRNKTDRTDTEALLEAARCAGIQPVPVKTPEQQALQALHRVRTQWQQTRTARTMDCPGTCARRWRSSTTRCAPWNDASRTSIANWRALPRPIPSPSASSRFRASASSPRRRSSAPSRTSTPFAEVGNHPEPWHP